MSNFSSLLIDGMETKKKYKSVLLVSKYLTIAKTQQNLHNRPKGIIKNWLKIDNFIKWRLQHFFSEILEIFQSNFSSGTPPVNTSDQVRN